MIETWENGKQYDVKRNAKGQFITWKIYEPIRIEPSKPLREINYKYDVIIRIAYKGKMGHDRHAEISGIVISNTPLADSTIISRCLDAVRNKDYWIDYVEPNQKTIIHIREDRTNLSEKTDVIFKDLG